ncbi:BTB incomplete domain containing protein [Pandoravirus salinus]|uniref:BTB incomplete domain containing protein n=1 Tax=Pandoravirus salinus TaxID=1349410 RepID=S4W411_9VIRU|nr:BTB incomplete domain [Pandoravirus salinus]AGO85040.1 BTB incomplete domain containing protein [Pandoravirus salinus]
MQCTKPNAVAAEGRRGYICLNVGGTIRHVEQALIGTAPPGSLARAYLTVPPDATDAHFVDERPQHFARLIDCLRHGYTALAFMHPYDAGIVRALLASDQEEEKETVDGQKTGHAKDGAESMQGAEATTDPAHGAVVIGCDGTARLHLIDPVVRLLVDDHVHMDVARSTLARLPDSLLARMARNDAGWSPATDGDRLCIDQNHRHFGLLIDCLRHGTHLLQLVDDIYDLWGVRALGTYYAIDDARDAAQLAIGWRGYLEADKNVRCTTYIVQPGTSASIADFDRSRPVPRHVVTYFMHSSRVSPAEFVALAAAAVGAPPDAVVVYASPYGDKWYPIAGDDDDTDYCDCTRYLYDSGRVSFVMVEPRSVHPLVVADAAAAIIAATPQPPCL